MHKNHRRKNKYRNEKAQYLPSWFGKLSMAKKRSRSRDKIQKEGYESVDKQERFWINAEDKWTYD